MEPKNTHINVDTSNAFVHRHGFISPYESSIITTPLLKFDVLSDTTYSPFWCSSKWVDNYLSFIGITGDWCPALHRILIGDNSNSTHEMLVDVRYDLSGPCWLSTCDRRVRNRSEGRVAHLPGDRHCNAELSASPSSQQLLTTWRFVPTKQRSQYDDSSRWIDPWFTF